MENKISGRKQKRRCSSLRRLYPGPRES